MTDNAKCSLNVNHQRAKRYMLRMTSLSYGNVRFSTLRKIQTLSPIDSKLCTVDNVGDISELVKF
jgi:hypothetical protein